MSGALVGFRIDGEKKLMRLHGQRSCAAVLDDLLSYLRATDDAQVAAYARLLFPVGATDRPKPDAKTLALLQPFLPDPADSGASWGWDQIFARYPDLSGWHAGLPCLPAASYDRCGDVSWGFLLDLDAHTLQIHVNQHGRFDWRDLACGHPPFCTVPLAHVRVLDRADLAALQTCLTRHAFSDGSDPQLPIRDGRSPAFAGPGDWQMQLESIRGRVRLILMRGPVHARLRQVGELRLDDPGGGAFLCAALDPGIRRLAQAIYGPGASLTQVARVASQWPQLPFSPDGSALPLLDLGLRPSSGLALPLGGDFFDALRARLLHAGMSHQGWRFLVKQNAAVLRLLLDFFPPSAGQLRDFNQFVNLLASALQQQQLQAERCLPALRGIERILARTRGRPDAIREENARLFLRAIVRARLTPQEQDNLGHEAQDVADFVYVQRTPLKGVTWRSLCRRSQAWHRALLIEVDPDKDVRWPALLPQFTVGAIQAVELNCGRLLAEDGLEQRHCIGSYANACATGASRIFSLRRDGKRAATLELQRGHDGNWRSVQLRGKANCIVTDTAVHDAADAVARAYAQAVRTHGLTLSPA